MKETSAEGPGYGNNISSNHNDNPKLPETQGTVKPELKPSPAAATGI
jgi:hypothetical protein